MDDKELLSRLKDYDAEKDIRDKRGNYGIYLANLVYQKSKKFKDLRKWLMMAGLSALENEALEKMKFGESVSAF